MAKIFNFLIIIRPSKFYQFAFFDPKVSTLNNVIFQASVFKILFLFIYYLDLICE